MGSESRSARGIQSITVGGRLLQALIDGARPMTLREIADRAEIAPAQAHAYLVSHRRTGMVVQEFDSGPYLFGPFALKLGLARLRALPVYGRAEALLKSLSQELNVMSVLAVWGPGGPSAVMVVQASDKRSDLNIRMGTRFSVLNTATGRIFGAHHDPAQVEPHVAAEFARSPAAFYPTDVAGPEDFAQRVAEVRDQGFASIRGARVPGIDAIAAPIFDEDGQFAGAVTCIGHAEHIDTGPEGAAVRALLGGAARLNAADAASDT
ncbi:IclR family transcriptional regulator [Mangrovicoccus ximenensis]|uniref:IclR family transcriptional regulator n=1 Tax=Mangrovicoccus ximenensis TaxID=1911570 RepID=UPI0022AA0EF9|nr:IclR family transcriptional regulator [Mangrovicoccus ximenensis]